MDTRRPTSLNKFYILWAGQTVSQLGSSMTALALSVWAFQQRGTVMSVSLLMVCSYLPAALASIAAGAVTDRFSKRRIMLIADTVAAAVSLTILALLSAGRLTVEALYAANAVLGAAGAFQAPASQVAVTLLTPREQYMRVSGLQSLSDACRDILAPVLAGTVLAFGGLRTVLLIDLSTFSAAFISLLCLRIPDPAASTRTASPTLRRQIAEGVRWVGGQRFVGLLIGYVWLINLISGMSYFSVLSPMILARTGGNEQLMGLVNGFLGAGALAGSLLLAWRQPKGSRAGWMTLCYTLSFLTCDLWLGIGRTPVVWCMAAFLGNLPLPLGNGALSTLFRERTPVALQGRVFALRDMGRHGVLLLGYLLGAWLADTAAPALCALPGFIGDGARWLVGVGDGRAMGLVFVLTGVLGTAGSLLVGLMLRRREAAERTVSGETHP